MSSPIQQEWYRLLLQDLESRGLSNPQEIGRGGMGHVLRAWDNDLDRWIAIKVITPAAGSSPEHVRRFQAEMRLLGRIHHASVVTVHGGRITDHFAYFLMSYVDGDDLRHQINHRRTLGRPFNVRDTVDYLRPIADALDALHQMNPPVIHRDIKPANILIPDNPDGMATTVLTDFGISLVAGDTRLTQVGTVIGSEKYMAPERYRNGTSGSHQSEIRADNYALALVAWEMLTLTPLMDTMSLEQWRFGTRDPRLTAHQLAAGERGKAESLTGLFGWLLSTAESQRPASARTAIDSLAAFASTADQASQVLGSVPVSAYGSALDGPLSPTDSPDPRRPRPSYPASSRPGTNNRERSTDTTPRPVDRREMTFRRRRRTAVVTLVLLVVLAVGGFVGQRMLHDDTTPNDLTDSRAGTGDEWAPHQAPIVDSFPLLVPRQPGFVGETGLRCEPSTPGDGKLALINCSAPSITVELARFPSTDIRNRTYHEYPADHGVAQCPGTMILRDLADRTLFLPDNMPVSVTVTATAHTVETFLDALCPAPSPDDTAHADPVPGGPPPAQLYTLGRNVPTQGRSR